jgi:hypothetical protein
MMFQMRRISTCFVVAAPTTVLPPGVTLQLEDAQDASNQTIPEPCAVAGTEYGHGQQVQCTSNSRL